MAVGVIEIPVDYSKARDLCRKFLNDPRGYVLNDSVYGGFEEVARSIMHHPTTERLAFAVSSLVAASRGAIDAAEYWKYLAGI